MGSPYHVVKVIIVMLVTEAVIPAGTSNRLRRRHALIDIKIAFVQA
jgi:hypothetical protein